MTSTVPAWTPFSKRFPGYSIKGLKTWDTDDGYGYVLDLHKDGRKVARAQEEGHGGELRIDFASPEGEKELLAFTEQKRLEIPADLESSPGYKNREHFNVRLLVEEMFIAWDLERRLRRMVKSKTVFTVPGDDHEKDGFRTLPYIFTAKVASHLRAKYPGGVVIVNEELGSRGDPA